MMKKLISKYPETTFDIVSIAITLAMAWYPLLMVEIPLLIYSFSKESKR